MVKFQIMTFKHINAEDQIQSGMKAFLSQPLGQSPY